MNTTLPKNHKEYIGKTYILRGKPLWTIDLSSRTTVSLAIQH